MCSEAHHCQRSHLHLHRSSHSFIPKTLVHASLYTLPLAVTMFVSDATGIQYMHIVDGVCVLAAAAALYLVYRSQTPHELSLPSSPPGDPILGHIRKIPLEYSWIEFGKWAKKYGDVIYVHVLGKPMIILNTYAAARDLMEKRGRNYSDRRKEVLIGEV